MKKLAIFVSGSGTNMENILQHIKDGKIQAEAALIISDNPNAQAIQRAQKFGIQPVIVDRKKFDSKEKFEEGICRQVDQKKIDFIILAGFMRILSPSFVKSYSGRILNIHPSYLPQFPGAHAIRDAFENKTKLLVSGTGVSVHFVTEQVDGGPVIKQAHVPIHQDDTLESLEKRIHETEYKLYPEALNLVLDSKS